MCWLRDGQAGRAQQSGCSVQPPLLNRWRRRGLWGRRDLGALGIPGDAVARAPCGSNALDVLSSPQEVRGRGKEEAGEAVKCSEPVTGNPCLSKWLG